MKRFVIAGFTSGVITAVLFNWFIPFLFLGTILGVSLLLALEKKIIGGRSILFIILSGIAFYTAIWTDASIGHVELGRSNVNLQIDNFKGLLSAGFAGALILLTSFHILIYKFRLSHFVLLLILGSVLSLSSYIYRNDNSLVSSYLLLIVWQTGIATGIGFAISSIKVTKGPR